MAEHRWAVAYHEAGHAVMALEYGFDLTSVSIHRYRNRHGRTIYIAPEGTHLRTLVTITLAGKYGETVSDKYHQEMLRSGTELDQERVENLLSPFPLIREDILTVVHRDLRRFFKQSRVRVAVDRVASALLHHRKLTGVEVGVLIDGEDDYLLPSSPVDQGRETI